MLPDRFTLLEPIPPLSATEREQLRDEAFFVALARRIYCANNPAHRPLLRAIIENEIALRPTTPDHDGDRLVLLCLLLAQQHHYADLELCWQVKQLDFDMGCLLDAELFVLAGVAETLAWLQAQQSSWAIACLSYLNECQASGAFDDLEGYRAGRLAYFGLG